MIHLTVTMLPSFYFLSSCAEAIAVTHGEARAEEWFAETLAANEGLFMRVETTPQKPRLSVIRGGA